MAAPKRRAFHEMDHDHELLREEIVFASLTEPRGPIPAFLAKKRAPEVVWSQYSPNLTLKWIHPWTALAQESRGS